MNKFAHDLKALGQILLIGTGVILVVGAVFMIAYAPTDWLLETFACKGGWCE